MFGVIALNEESDELIAKPTGSIEKDDPLILHTTRIRSSAKKIPDELF